MAKKQRGKTGSDAWEWIELGYWPQERLVGFSIPHGPELVVIDSWQTYRFDLAEGGMVQSFPDNPEGDGLYDRSRTFRLEGKVYPILDWDGGTPILKSRLGEQMVLDADLGTLEVFDARGLQTLRFKGDPREDWAQATFSDDSNYIVLGFPHGLNAFRRRRAFHPR